MLARRILPASYQEWNRKWGAPFGYPKQRGQRYWEHFLSERARTRLAGPFSIQPNSQTREFEYPWAFHAAPLHPGMQTLDVGGGLAGFQFVLAKSGLSVINVDPGFAAEGKGWKCDSQSIRELNEHFGTSIDLRNCTMREAGLERNSIDIAFSISVIEHLVDAEILETAKYVWDCLKVGGKFVLTVDLFLNLLPFTNRRANEYGINFPVGQLTRLETFSLLSGQPKEIYGMDEFDKEQILSTLELYYVGAYPGLAQCLVLQKN